MKKKELQTLKNKSKAELEKDVRELYGAVEKLKFDLVLGKVKNIKEIRKAKKNIARIATVLREGRDKS